MYKSKVDDEIWQDVEKGIEYYEVRDVNFLLKKMALQNYSLATVPEVFALKYPNEFYLYASYRTKIKPAEITFVSPSYITKFPKNFSLLARDLLNRSKGNSILIDMTLSNAKKDANNQKDFYKLEKLEQFIKEKTDRQK